MSTSRRLTATACELGACTSACTSSGDESTSPMPVMPSSVWMRTTRSSWLPSAIPSSTTAWRRTMASTSVIFTGLSPDADGGSWLEPTARIVDYSEIVNNPLGWPRCHERLSDHVHDRPGGAREAVRRAASAALVEHRRLGLDGRPDRRRGGWRRSHRARARRRARRRARGPGGCAVARARARAGARARPGDRDPVRVAGGVPGLDAPVAVGREHEPLLSRLARRHARRAARALPLDGAVPDGRRRDRHAQRRPLEPVPALGRDALGRGRRAAAPDGRGDAGLEHGLVQRLHRHRRHRPARRRGGAPGKDRDRHRARRWRPRHRRDPPAGGERAAQRPAGVGRDRGCPRDAGGARAARTEDPDGDGARQLPARAGVGPVRGDRQTSGSASRRGRRSGASTSSSARTVRRSRSLRARPAPSASIRAIATTEKGDCVAVVAREVDRSELL